MKILNKYKDENEFYSLVRIKWKTFEKMVEILKKAEFKQKQFSGRKNKLSIEKRLMMTLERLKENSTYRILGKKYNINYASCLRNIFWIENELVKAPEFQIPNKKELLKNKYINTLFAIDATETPIRRIKKK